MESIVIKGRQDISPQTPLLLRESGLTSGRPSLRLSTTTRTFRIPAIIDCQEPVCSEILEKQVEAAQEERTSDSSSTSYDDSGSDSDSSSDSEVDSDDDSITQEYLASLIEKAKANIREIKGKQVQKKQEAHQEDVLLLDKEEEEDGDDDDVYCLRATKTL